MGQRSTHERLGRRLVLGAALGFAAAMAAGAVAWGQAVQGSTWYDDGSFVKSGPSPATVIAWATDAKPTTQFELVSGTNTSSGHEDHACLDLPAALNPSPRVSDARGFIPFTAGTLSRPPGDWQVCFRELPSSATATSPVFFTVL